MTPYGATDLWRFQMLREAPRALDNNTGFRKPTTGEGETDRVREGGGCGKGRGFWEGPGLLVFACCIPEASSREDGDCCDKATQRH